MKKGMKPGFMKKDDMGKALKSEKPMKKPSKKK